MIFNWLHQIVALGMAQCIFNIILKWWQWKKINFGFIFDCWIGWISLGVFLSALFARNYSLYIPDCCDINPVKISQTIFLSILLWFVFCSFKWFLICLLLAHFHCHALEKANWIIKSVENAALHERMRGRNVYNTYFGRIQWYGV